MKRNISIAVLVLILVYALSYVCVRQIRTEVLDHDGNKAVIFQDKQALLYYIYQPLILLDKTVTKIEIIYIG